MALSEVLGGGASTRTSKVGLCDLFTAISFTGVISSGGRSSILEKLGSYCKGEVIRVVEVAEFLSWSFSFERSSLNKKSEKSERPGLKRWQSKRVICFGIYSDRAFIFTIDRSGIWKIIIWVRIDSWIM